MTSTLTQGRKQLRGQVQRRQRQAGRADQQRGVHDQHPGGGGGGAGQELRHQHPGHLPPHHGPGAAPSEVRGRGQYSAITEHEKLSYEKRLITRTSGPLCPSFLVSFFE